MPAHFIILKKGLCTCFMCVGVLPACVSICTACACSARGGQKRALDPLKLEVQMIIICYVGVAN